MDRLCVQEGPGRGVDTGVTETLAVDELVSMEWSEVQEEDSESCKNIKLAVTYRYTKQKTSLFD